MKLAPRLALRQSQSLVMTPQLQQAIKLLQLSNVEATAFVERELEQNPLLERDEREESDDGQAPSDASGESAARAETREGEPLLDAIGRDDEGKAAPETPLDVEGEDWWSEAANGLANWRGSGGRSDFAEDDASTIEISRPPTLREHLLEQIVLDIADPSERIIALNLLDLLDDAGYVTSDLAGLAERLGCPSARLEAMLARLQRLDPPGVFARSLRECLAIQLRERDRFDPAMQKLVEHLELLAKRELSALARLCGVDGADLVDMIGEIKALDPRPGQRFDRTPIEPVVPDVLMRARADGGWHIELNPDTLPRVLVNTRYYAEVAKGARTKAERDYLAERFQSANWLVKSLHQRAQTILKVASEIVRQQDAFFRRGVQHLRPLVLRDIAEAIDMHESTVSRVTTNKYLAAPQGIYELKYFFTSAIGSVDGAATHSAEAVRSRIRMMIEGETAAEVLSDDRIVDQLRREGVDIARRTVAKYREAMRIPSSVQRRREKMLGL